MTPWLAFVASAAVAVAAQAWGWLSRGGAAAAVLVGTCVLTGAGVAGMGLLGLFFISSSALTAWRATPQRNPALRRTARQVIANGWTAAIGSLLVPIAPGLGWAVLVGGLATAQADTWATELGRSARHPPVLITTRRVVRRGTSGAVSTAGTLAGLAGSALLATLAWALGVPGPTAAVAAVTGTLGMLADSLLGATLQGVYHCTRCAVEVEVPTHHCGAATALVRGRRRVTNDTVNFVATGLGALLTVASAAVAR